VLRPWVPLIAVVLLTAIAWQLGSEVVAALGGALLGLALLSEAFARLAPLKEAWTQRRRKQALHARMQKLDWSVIDNSMASERVRRDCERSETLGVCTGMECLVYKNCTFNIKKPLP
jgi:hypothetical protein